MSTGRFLVLELVAAEQVRGGAGDEGTAFHLPSKAVLRGVDARHDVAVAADRPICSRRSHPRSGRGGASGNTHVAGVGKVMDCRPSPPRSSCRGNRRTRGYRRNVEPTLLADANSVTTTSSGPPQYSVRWMTVSLPAAHRQRIVGLHFAPRGPVLAASKPARLRLSQQNVATGLFLDAHVLFLR